MLQLTVLARIMGFGVAVGWFVMVFVLPLLLKPLVIFY